MEGKNILKIIFVGVILIFLDSSEAKNKESEGLS